MARFLRFQLILFSLTAMAMGQDPVPPGPPPPDFPTLHRQDDKGKFDRDRRPRRDGNRDNNRDSDRDRLQKNLERWKKMSPDDREAMRQLHDRRREAMRRDVQQVIESSGLKLEGKRLEQFVNRYREERRELEEQIRREMEAVRTERLKTIVDKLRAEFQATEEPAAEEPDAEETPAEDEPAMDESHAEEPAPSPTAEAAPGNAV